ncbi:DEAD/DEAH box helicase [bacterium]|nr:DEAD/DEAH box helicase [bacterium]
MPSIKLTDIKGVGKVIEAKLNSLDIFNPRELITRLPRSYIDLDKVTPLGSALDGDYCLLDINIISKSKPYKGKIRSIFRAEGKCEDFLVKLNWFNSSYPSKTLEIGEIYTFYGKVKINGFVVELNNPAFEKKGEITKFTGILPIYITKGLIPQGTYRALIKNALPLCTFESVIPISVEQKYKLKSLSEAYQNLHFPKVVELQNYKERVALEKIVRRLGAFSLAREIKGEKKNNYRETDISPLIKVLDFELNSSQKEAFISIKKTLLGAKNLNAILCGDVGSGKTIVAIFACFFAIKNGFQAAFMAPTEILAKQHYDKICALFVPLNLKVKLLTGSTSSALRTEIIEGLKNGSIDIIVGTHSLLSDDVKFRKLGIVIADEQHRFGVAQRTKLIKKAQSCDLLTLSATPIPRSMQLIAYGEVEVINIERRFLGNVFTKLVTKEKRTDMWEYIAAYCQKGGQAFVVAPQIYDSEGIEKSNVIALQKEISASAKGIKTAALHGKLKPEVKEKII